MRNAPHGLRHMNTWSPVGGALGGGSEGTALLEEVHHVTGQALGAHCTLLLAVCILYFLLAAYDTSAQLSAPATMPDTCGHASPP